MGTRQEIGKQLFAGQLNMDYLEHQDQYLFTAPEAKVRLNVVGIGMMGMEHCKVTMLEGRATIHGFYDADPHSRDHHLKALSSAHPGQKFVVYDTLQSACNDPDVDGLIICTPNWTHVDVVREAVKSRKHILLEKPMATTIADAYEITKLAEGYEGVFQIGLQYRFKAIYAEAIHEALERKAIGDIKTISIQEHRVPFLDKVKQWNKFTKYSGGTLVEKCCHYFDLFNLFAQSKPDHVYATGGTAVNFQDFEYAGERSDILDHACVTVVYQNGIRASFNLCMFAPMFYEEIVLCGNEGRLKAYENTDYLPVHRKETHLEVLSGLHRPSRISTPCYPANIQHSGHHGATYYEHKYFIDNIEGNKTNTASVEEGFWSIVVGVAAEESVKTGNVVQIEELLAESGIRV
ncbi:Gfo/Idh/MocA family protein [Alicyclobacillus dauci]|uniref:Gfo/Idh/MocA family oxidoreductase n=1 Tax=Alicyclobacillus dauci TaxID=1475485 RepID=A0ABY6Z2J7_9BACL|nr:Gfo/Idh/MocA family oxidoreductase [Alicyclobacillus dauci]WAH36546.1 Gfo/Idh/MocA family oxidoreductase [Alicyclobacillus dauci]